MINNSLLGGRDSNNGIHQNQGNGMTRNMRGPNPVVTNEPNSKLTSNSPLGSMHVGNNN